MKVITIILAAGQSTRFNQCKIVYLLNQKPVISYSLETFSTLKEIDQIIVVANQKNIKVLKKICLNFPKVTQVVLGGKSRFQSSLKGFKAFSAQKEDLLIFHNAANPFVSQKEILLSLKKAQKNGSAGVGHKVSNTIRQINEKNSLTLKRENIFLMETPQVLKAEIFIQGAQIAKQKNIDPTDDLTLAELSGKKVSIITASANNKKITYQQDLAVAENIPKSFLKLKNITLNKINTKNNNLKIGFGHDSHPFSSKGVCTLAGVKFSSFPALQGNSDGDVALHALCNAMLSTFSSGSFSRLADTLCKKGIKDSSQYVKLILKKFQQNGGQIERCVFSFECLRPKLENKFPQMQKKLAKILNISLEKISFIATSGEKLTSFGQGKGVQVFVILLANFGGADGI